jgi:hypothetical protein
VTAYGLNKKNEEALGNLIRYVEVDLLKLGKYILHYHADGAGELVRRDTLDYLENRGISYSWNPRDTSEMNAITEKKWSILNQMARCMLLRSGFPADFWWNAYHAAV